MRKMLKGSERIDEVDPKLIFTWELGHCCNIRRAYNNEPKLRVLCAGMGVLGVVGMLSCVLGCCMLSKMHKDNYGAMLLLASFVVSWAPFFLANRWHCKVLGLILAFREDFSRLEGVIGKPGMTDQGKAVAIARSEMVARAVMVRLVQTVGEEVHSKILKNQMAVTNNFLASMGLMAPTDPEMPDLRHWFDKASEQVRAKIKEIAEASGWVVSEPPPAVPPQ